MALHNILQRHMKEWLILVLLYTAIGPISSINANRIDDDGSHHNPNYTVQTENEQQYYYFNSDEYESSYATNTSEIIRETTTPTHQIYEENIEELNITLSARTDVLETSELALHISHSLEDNKTATFAESDISSKDTDTGTSINIDTMMTENLKTTTETLSQEYVDVISTSMKDIHSMHKKIINNFSEEGRPLQSTESDNTLVTTSPTYTTSTQSSINMYNTNPSFPNSFESYKTPMSTPRLTIQASVEREVLTFQSLTPQMSTNQPSTRVYHINPSEVSSSKNHYPKTSTLTLQSSAQTSTKNERFLTTSVILDATSSIPTLLDKHQKKKFLFKHISNLTESQRYNMTVGIKFTSSADIVKWFQTYDEVFRNYVASFFTKTKGNKNINLVNIIYIAPTPLKSEKYICVSFMVESAILRNVYKPAKLVVRKIKENMLQLTKELQLAVVSVSTGYNELDTCDDSTIPDYHGPWIIGLSLIPIVVLVLTSGIMCVQKFKNHRNLQLHQLPNMQVRSTRGNVYGRYIQASTMNGNSIHLPSKINENSTPNVVHISVQQEDNHFVANTGIETVLIHREEDFYLGSTLDTDKYNHTEDTKL